MVLSKVGTLRDCFFEKSGPEQRIKRKREYNREYNNEPQVPLSLFILCAQLPFLRVIKFM
jgi:hypothetical protein